MFLQKLDKALKLPENISIQKAKVLRLRISIPLDIYSSPIKVEVDGVEIRLKVSSIEGNKSSRSRRTGRDEETLDIVPTAADLAQSFLETQSSREKRELEQALTAETQDLGASVAVSDDGSEDEHAFGTGQGLSLPAFMTDFMHGVVDRTQIKIQGVKAELDVEVPLETGETTGTTPETVTFQLALDKLDIEGVTAQAQGTVETPKIVHKEGKRHILLENIRAVLISEANVFSTFARSPSISSSVASRSPVMTDKNPPSREGSFMAQSQYAGAVANSDDNLAESRYTLRDSEDAFNIPYEFDGSSDGGDVDDQEPVSSHSTPRASLYQDFADQHESQLAQLAVMEDEPLHWGDLEGSNQSARALRDDDVFFQEQRQQPHSLADSTSTSSGSASNASETQPVQDLTQSLIFTHDEAESMYMSALSQADSDRRRTSAMPGAWDSNPPSPERSPRASRTATTPVPAPLPEYLTETGEPGSRRSEDRQSPAPLQTAAQEPINLAEADRNTEAPEVNVESVTQGRPDEAATPKGPTRLVKEIVSLESISLYIPTTHKHLQVSAPDGTSGLARSISPNVPGTYSVYSATSPSQSRASSLSQSRTISEPADTKHDDTSFEAIFAPLEVRFDASVGFLLATVVSKLMEAVQRQPRPSGKGKETTQSAESETSLPAIKLTAQKISVLFLEKMAGVADTAERHFHRGTMNFEPDVLLKAGLENLQATMSQTSSETKTSVDFEKFHFGYVDSNILSFDRRIQMHASARDALPAAGADVSVRLSTSKESTKVDVTTLPLRVHLDLQRLDETFGWFGGLSGFLQMGSSMTSNAPQAAKPSKPVRPRGVRFDTPIKPDDKSAASENKTNTRIGGLQLELIGKDCHLALNTSAVKLVSRDEGVGIAISKIHFSGPHQQRFPGEAPINVEITTTRLEFLPTPKDTDLDRLLELILPSKGRFDDDDDLMVDTLLRQRRKGSVLRLYFDNVKADVIKIQQLACLPALSEELARLGTVAKYLPEDDRPGMLALGLTRNLDVSIDVGGRFGVVNTKVTDLELAQITIPSLIAFGVKTIAIERNNIEELVGSSNVSRTGLLAQTPVLMVRIIGDEMEPVIKVKMRNLNFEYRVPTVMDILGLTSEATPQDFEASLAASVAHLGGQAQTALTSKPAVPTQASSLSKSDSAKPTVVNVAFRDCLVGLNPLGLTSKLNVILTDAKVEVGVPRGADLHAVAYLNKASMLLIDDISLLDAKQEPYPSRYRAPDVQRAEDLVSTLCSKGYVDICQISAARATVQVTADGDGEKLVDVELRDDLLVLETCADSTHTLIALANALKPPTPPSKAVKYKTHVVPLQDMLASIAPDAFGKAEGEYNFDDDFAMAPGLDSDSDSFEDHRVDRMPLGIESQYYRQGPEVSENMFDATSSSMISDRTTTEDTKDGVLLTNFSATADAEDSCSDFEIHENFFGTESVLEGTAHQWDSAKNTYDRTNDHKVQRSPLKVCIRDVHIIWNLFDGYDWQHTRDSITKTVQEVEIKAHERRRGKRRSMGEPDFDEEEEVIGDFLFNSIYIGIGANHDPKELTKAINQQLDQRSETESIATSAATSATTRAAGGFRSRAKKLRLSRSRHHKITFELQKVNVDLVTFPPGSGETDSSIDVRVGDLTVFDHIATSTYKKFAAYDQDVGERQMGTSMVHLEILNVRPKRDLAATEIVLKATVLPLLLHVDQDALNFIARFFEFKDDSQPSVHASPSDVPFIQRGEIMSIPVQLHFKPKRVDYAGLRAGRTTELMNFMTLDDSRMVMRHTIVYGVTGFDRFGQTLNDVWMPDVKSTQLGGVLAGIAPVRSLVSVGNGFRDLIEIPIREYRKDGRIVRGIGKGAAAFARTTGTEIIKLGAKMAIGTQYILQNAEDVLGKGSGSRPGSSGGESSSLQTGWDGLEVDDEEKKQISLYADQPTGVGMGLRHAYSSLSRDLMIAKDAIIAIPGEVMESQSAKGAVSAIVRGAPTIILRPAIGATKAMGYALKGATNSLDPENIRRMEDVSFPSSLVAGFEDDADSGLAEIQVRARKTVKVKSFHQETRDAYMHMVKPQFQGGTRMQGSGNSRIALPKSLAGVFVDRIKPAFTITRRSPFLSFAFL